MAYLVAYKDNKVIKNYCRSPFCRGARNIRDIYINVCCYTLPALSLSVARGFYRFFVSPPLPPPHFGFRPQTLLPDTCLSPATPTSRSTFGQNTPKPITNTSLPFCLSPPPPFRQISAGDRRFSFFPRSQRERENLYFHFLFCFSSENKYIFFFKLINNIKVIFLFKTILL